VTAPAQLVDHRLSDPCPFVHSHRDPHGQKASPRLRSVHRLPLGPRLGGPEEETS
jgi:hypothetical protein